MKIKTMLIYTAVQLGNSGLLVNSTCEAQKPITNYEDVIVKMGARLNSVYLCQIFFVSNCRILAYALTSVEFFRLFIFFPLVEKKKCFP